MMLFSYKKTSFLILSITALLLIASCGSVGDDDGAGENGSGEVSNSTNSSEIGDGFILQPKSSGDAYLHAASVVIGQSNFRNNGDEEPSANSVSLPYGNPTVVDDNLYLPDFGNKRVLGYTTVPTSDGKNADFVVGQSTFIDKLSGATEYRNRGAQTVTVANGKLFVTDWDNSRILIYNKRPIGEPAKADIVVGQTDFGLSDPDSGNNHLNQPESLYVVGNKLIVADSGNNRVLIWNSIPSAHDAKADIVLGQIDFDGNKENQGQGLPSSNTLYFPTAVWSDGVEVVVLDAGNNRIMIWNLNNLDSDKNAYSVLGQNTFYENYSNQDVTTSASTLSFSIIHGGGLYVNKKQPQQL